MTYMASKAQKFGKINYCKGVCNIMILLDINMYYHIHMSVMIRGVFR